MCRRWVVATRCEKNGKIEFGVFDCEDSFVNNKVFLIDPSKDERKEITKLFHEKLGDSQTGTVFAMYDFHNLDNDRNAKRFAEVLSNENNAARTYRYPLKDLDLPLRINGKDIAAADPMALDDPETIVPSAELPPGSAVARQWAKNNYAHYDPRMVFYEFRMETSAQKSASSEANRTDTESVDAQGEPAECATSEEKVFYYGLLPSYQPPKTFGSGGSRKGKEAGRPGISILYMGREIGHGKGHGILSGMTNEYGGLNLELHIFDPEMLTMVGANFTKFGGEIQEPLRQTIKKDTEDVRKFCAEIFRQNNEDGKVDKANKKLEELLESYKDYVYDEREQLKWLPGMRQLMYRHLVEEFGPCNTWQGLPNPPHASRSGRAFHKVVEDLSYMLTEMLHNVRPEESHKISKSAVLQQIFHVTQKQSDDKKKNLSTSQRMTAVLNLAAAYFAGFADSETQKDILGDKEYKSKKSKLKAVSE